MEQVATMVAGDGHEEPIRLGLIGDNIAASQSPLLHRLAGQQVGRTVVYERLVPRVMGLGFDEVFQRCLEGGYRGINVTYPYKERVTAKLGIDDGFVRQLGAVNTVLFEAEGPKGFNTDFTGFIAAYRASRGDAPPGKSLMIGAGGVGRAVAFGLITLGLREIVIVDRDLPRAQALGAALVAMQPNLSVATGTDAAQCAAGACGIINCTPVGMAGLEGSPLPARAMAGADWAFDAVYTPVETKFLKDALAAGLGIISGYELFFAQGVDAWELFTGLPIDHAQLRADLALEG